MVVLVDCSGCRSRREASGPSVHALGSSHPASCSDGERASEAGSRRQSRENGGGLSMIPYPRSARLEGAGSEHSSREGVLVSTKRSPLTRGSRRRAWRLRRAGPAERLDPVRATLRQRTSEVTPWARYADENSAAGWCHAEEPSIEAPPGSRSASSPPSRDARANTPVASRDDAGRRGHAEAGGSPSSEAPPGDSPEVFDRRWIGRARSRAREGAGPTMRSGIGQSRGCSYIRLVAEVGETHLSRRRREPRGNPRGARAEG